MLPSILAEDCDRVTLKIETRNVDGVTVIGCTGQITLGQATSTFRNTIREQIQAGSKKLLLDLAAVTYLDSTGIGELVGAYTSAHNAEAQIKLARLPLKVRELLHITRLITVFEVFEDEAEAVRSFR